MFSSSTGKIVGDQVPYSFEQLDAVRNADNPFASQISQNGMLYQKSEDVLCLRPLEGRWVQMNYPFIFVVQQRCTHFSLTLKERSNTDFRINCLKKVGALFHLLMLSLTSRRNRTTLRGPLGCRPTS